MDLPLPSPLDHPAWIVAILVVLALFCWHFIDGIAAILRLIIEAGKWLLSLVRKKRP